MDRAKYEKAFVALERGLVLTEKLSGTPEAQRAAEDLDRYFRGDEIKLGLINLLTPADPQSVGDSGSSE